LIGVSTHSTAEVAAAAADYAHLAPIFPPRSKPSSRPSLGCEAIAEAVRAGFPVIAQGGIDATNAAAVRAAGAFGVAVTGAILSAPDVGTATAAIRRALG
jgi:thiamine-phosphate pyrophosphorylase